MSNIRNRKARKLRRAQRNVGRVSLPYVRWRVRQDLAEAYARGLVERGMIEGYEFDPKGGVTIMLPAVARWVTVDIRVEEPHPSQGPEGPRVIHTFTSAPHTEPHP